MRILQVSSQVPPYHTGGAERCCAELARALSVAGHEVQIAAPVPEGRVGPIPIRELPRMSPRLLQKLVYDYTSPRTTAALEQIIEEMQPDVVHFHNIYGIGSAAIAATSKICPTIVTLHDYWPIDIVAPLYAADGRLQYPLRSLPLWPWKELHRRIHGHHLRRTQLVAPSSFLAGRVGEVLGRAVDVIRNGVDLQEPTAARESSVLFVGRLVPEKGIDSVLPSALKVARRFGWTVDVVGAGPLLERLRRRYTEVRFHGRMDPAPFYRRSAVLVVPSIWPENAPYAILDGLSFGIAVLAAASGGIPELITQGEDGLLHSPGDSVAFAHELERLLHDSELRAALGRSARQHAERHAWPMIADEYVDMYVAVEERLGERRRTLVDLPRESPRV